jgi:hypothetical protein
MLFCFWTKGEVGDDKIALLFQEKTSKGEVDT